MSNLINIGLYIPSVNENVDQYMVEKVIQNLNLGDVDTVNMLSKGNFNRVYIRFNYWNDTDEVQKFHTVLNSGKYVKIFYNEVNFWKVYKSEVYKTDYLRIQLPEVNPELAEMREIIAKNTLELERLRLSIEPLTPILDTPIAGNFDKMLNSRETLSGSESESESETEFVSDYYTTTDTESDEDDDEYNTEEEDEDEYDQKETRLDIKK